MIKNLSVMANINDVCAKLRQIYFGDGTARDYKDSYVVCHAIDQFVLDGLDLLTDDTIITADKGEKKIAKTITFRSASYEKLCDISKMLGVPESEALRRLLIYSIKSKGTPQYKSSELTHLKDKITVLWTQLEGVMATMYEIQSEITTLEKMVQEKEEK